MNHWFKPAYFEGRNIDETWFNGLKTIAKYGRKYIKTQGSGAKKDFLELDHASGVIYHPIEYTDSGVMLPLAPTVPDGCPVPTTDASIQKYFLDDLMNGICEPNQHYKYATFIVGGRHNINVVGGYGPTRYVPGFNRDGIEDYPSRLTMTIPNQLQWCINHFLKRDEQGLLNFQNNHCVIQIGYPESQLEYDKPYVDETDRGTSPCCRIIDLKVIKNKDEWYLCAYVYFRAWNLYAGWPENLGGIALLQEYVAGSLSVDFPVKVGPLSFFSKSLNVYCDMLDALKLRTGSSTEFGYLEKK